LGWNKSFVGMSRRGDDMRKLVRRLIGVGFEKEIEWEQ
jgi:hypothetical protein